MALKSMGMEKPSPPKHPHSGLSLSCPLQGLTVNSAFQQSLQMIHSVSLTFHVSIDVKKINKIKQKKFS